VGPRESPIVAERVERKLEDAVYLSGERSGGSIRRIEGLKRGGIWAGELGGGLFCGWCARLLREDSRPVEWKKYRSVGAVVARLR